MTTLVIINGEIKLLVQPGNDIERELLKELFKGPVQAVIPDRIEVLGKNYTDSVIISAVKVVE